MKKKGILISIIIIVIIAISIILSLRKEIIVATDSIPSKGLLKAGTDEITFITTPLLYTPLIKLEDDSSYKLLLAKNIEINEDSIIVTLKDEKMAEKVKESYYEALENGFDTSYMGENIVGGREYIYGESSQIEGLTVKENKIEFKVKDTSDLEFLTLPMTKDVSDWKIKKIDSEELIIEKGLFTIKFELIENIKNNKFDIYVTKLPDVELPDYNEIELSSHTNYVGIVNFEETELNEIKSILNEESSSSSIEEITFWNDSSYNGVIVYDDLVHKLSRAGIKLNIDYCPQTYLYKLMNGQSKFIFFYDGDYLDRETFKIFDNFEYYELENADSFIYYNNETKNFVKNYLYMN